VWVIGVVSAAGTSARIRKPRSTCVLLPKRPASYSWPPNTFTTLWQSMVSCSTCTTSPSEVSTWRDMRRRRPEVSRTVSAIGGPITSTISVSFQFSHSR
jgi:hypothetical protein